MKKELMLQILNTLNTIEIKGYDNINKMMGVMLAIEQEIKEGEKDGTE